MALISVSSDSHLIGGLYFAFFHNSWRLHEAAKPISWLLWGHYVSGFLGLVFMVSLRLAKMIALLTLLNVSTNL